MKTLVLNKHIDGYLYDEIETVEVDKIEAENIVIVLDEKSNGEMDLYTRKIMDMARKGKRLILVEVENSTDIAQVCINYMLLYKYYDVYKVANANDISSDYVDTVVGRCASFTEVQAYIGTNTTSYGNITNLLGTIKQLIIENKQEDLENYIAENYKALHDMPEVLSNLIAKEELYNAKEWMAEFEELNRTIDEIKQELEGKTSELNTAFNELKDTKEELENKNVEIIEMKHNLQVMEIDIKAKQAELEGLAMSDSNAVNKMNMLIVEMNELKEKHQTSLDELNENRNKIGELTERIIAKEKEVEELTEKVKSTDSENSSSAVLEEALDESKKVIDRLNSTVSELNAEINELKKEINNGNNSQNADSGIIKTYSELHTSLINCKVDNILYFKEISYVNYMNSLIKAIIGMCNAAKIKVKLLIYDNCGVMSSTYNPLNIVNSTEFFRNKERLVKNVEAFVVTEPNQAIIESIVTCTDPKHEILIVYDRMKQLNNIITGNNVTNYWVANSSNDVKNIEQRLKINDKSRLIVGSNYHEKDQSIKIPTIPDYENKQGASTIAAYSKLVYNGTPIIQTILAKANIDLKHKRR